MDEILINSLSSSSLHQPTNDSDVVEIVLDKTDIFETQDLLVDESLEEERPRFWFCYYWCISESKLEDI